MRETRTRHRTACDELLKKAKTYARVPSSRFPSARRFQRNTLTHYGTWFATPLVPVRLSGALRREA